MTQIIIPERLVTDRLILRRPSFRDIEPYIDFFGTERSSMAMGPLGRVDAFKEFCLELGLWEIKGFGNYTVTHKDLPIGLVGIWHPEGWNEPEIGWLLWGGNEGKGFATEAALAVRNMVEDLGWSVPVSYIDVENHASKAVAERLGAHFESIHKRESNTEIWRHRHPQ